MSTTATRLLVVFGASLGGLIGAFVAIAKVLPERAGIITGYQLKVIEALQKENTEQAKKMLEMKSEIRELRKELRENRDEAREERREASS